MSLTRLFAIVAAVGLVMAVALTVRRMGITPAAAETPGKSVTGDSVVGIIALHKRQELADTSAPMTGTRPGNSAQGMIELHRGQEHADSAVSANSQGENLSIMRLHDRLERASQGQ